MCVWGQYPLLNLYCSIIAVIVLWFTSTTKYLYVILHICHDLCKNGKILTLTQVNNTGLEISVSLIMLIDIQYEMPSFSYCFFIL